MDRKRNYSSFSSGSSSYISNSGNSLGSVKKCSGSSNNSQLSGVCRNFSSKKLRITTVSQESANNQTFSDDIFNMQLELSDFSQGIGKPTKNDSPLIKNDETSLREYFSQFKNEDSNTQKLQQEKDDEDVLEVNMDFDTSLLPVKSFRKHTYDFLISFRSDMQSNETTKQKDGSTKNMKKQLNRSMSSVNCGELKQLNTGEDNECLVPVKNFQTQMSHFFNSSKSNSRSSKSTIQKNDFTKTATKDLNKFGRRGNSNKESQSNFKTNLLSHKGFGKEMQSLLNNSKTPVQNCQNKYVLCTQNFSDYFSKFRKHDVNGGKEKQSTAKSFRGTKFDLEPFYQSLNSNTNSTCNEFAISRNVNNCYGQNCVSTDSNLRKNLEVQAVNDILKLKNEQNVEYLKSNKLQNIPTEADGSQITQVSNSAIFNSSLKKSHSNLTDELTRRKSSAFNRFESSDNSLVFYNSSSLTDSFKLNRILEKQPKKTSKREKADDMKRTPHQYSIRNYSLSGKSETSDCFIGFSNSLISNNSKGADQYFEDDSFKRFLNVDNLDFERNLTTRTGSNLNVYCGHTSLDEVLNKSDFSVASDNFLSTAVKELYCKKFSPRELGASKDSNNENSFVFNVTLSPHLPKELNLANALSPREEFNRNEDNDINSQVDISMNSNLSLKNNLPGELNATLDSFDFNVTLSPNLASLGIFNKEENEFNISNNYRQFDAPLASTNDSFSNFEKELQLPLTTNLVRSNTTAYSNNGQNKNFNSSSVLNSTSSPNPCKGLNLPYLEISKKTLESNVNNIRSSQSNVSVARNSSSNFAEDLNLSLAEICFGDIKADRNIRNEKFHNSEIPFDLNSILSPKSAGELSTSIEVFKNEEDDFNFSYTRIDVQLPISSSNSRSNTPNKTFRSDSLSTGSKENFGEADKRLREGMNRISRDKSLIYTGPTVSNEEQNDQKQEIIKVKVLQIFHHLIEQAQQHRPVQFKVRNSALWNNCIFENEMLKLKSNCEAKTTIIKFAARGSRNKFNLIVFLLGKIYALLINNSICTQREIYYQLVNYLDNQNQIRIGMDVISSMLEVEPWYFPIVSTSKGLVFGDLTIIISPEEVTHCNSFGGTLIPQNVTKIKAFKSKAFFILVVEKDAIFKKLLDEDIPNKLTRPFIVITGKGFPDINTRLFVKKLWLDLRIPVFILVDADPCGIDIMLTYRFGSKQMSYVSENLALPSIRWLGVHPSEIVALNVTRQPLEEKERCKIQGMLKRPYVSENPWLKRELDVLLQNNFKAETEGIIKSNSYLTDFYLTNKFFSREYF